MAYFRPYTDEAGFHIPAYNDIKEDLLQVAKGVFGEDIYLGIDSQDYQFLAELADRIHDCYLTAQESYNNRGPSTAIGGGLDGLVKLNGIRRKQRTPSRCEVTIRGEPKTLIRNAIVADTDNINWSVLDTVTIGSDGVVKAIAQCQEYDHTVEAGEITKIVTPKSGWISVINENESSAGQEYETDAKLRARQAISTAKPSLTVLEALSGGIAEIHEVTRHRLYENDTDVFGYYGQPIPPHSIALVVEGGDEGEIAKEIYLRKTPGCYTYGDIEKEITGTDVYGKADNSLIRFFRPSYKDIHVVFKIKALAGYTSKVVADIKEKVYTYLNSVRIGDSLTLSALWAVALSTMPDIAAPIFSIVNVTAGFSSDEMSEKDLPILFYEVTCGDKDNICIEVV